MEVCVGGRLWRGLEVAGVWGYMGRPGSGRVLVAGSVGGGQVLGWGLAWVGLDDIVRGCLTGCGGS